MEKTRNGPRKRKRGFGLAMILLGLVLLALLLRARLDPLVEELAVASAKNAAAHAISAVVAEKMAAGELDYGVLVHMEKDDSGMITALNTDMRQVNRLQAAMSEAVIERLREPAAADLSVPLGNLSGIPLLSGRGPAIPIRILSVAESEAKLSGSFEHAGINQTLHRILLEMHAVVYVLIPGGSVTAEVSDTVTVAETVIVGRVPESYMYFESDDNWDEALEQYDILS